MSENFCARHLRPPRGTQLLNENEDKNRAQSVFSAIAIRLIKL